MSNQVVTESKQVWCDFLEMHL